MTVPSDAPALAHELLIGQLAVQRAALVTKRVFATINPETNHAPSSPDTLTSPISRFLHPPPPGPNHTFVPSNGGGAQDPDPAATAAAASLTGRRLSLAKPDTSPVTVADYAAQALLAAAVRAAFPDDLILGEEDAGALRADPDLAARVWELVEGTRLEDVAVEELLARPGSMEEMLAVLDAAAGGGDDNDEGGTVEQGGMGMGRRVWCMDPVDGTSAFLKGGQYAISLALLEDGHELVGVLGCPNLSFEAAVLRGRKVEERAVDRDGMGLMLAAVKGQGATVRPIGRGGLCPGVKIERGGAGRPVELSKLHFVDSSCSPATRTDKVRELAGILGAAYPAQTELYSSHMRYAAMALGGPEFVQLRWPRTPKAGWSIWDHAGSQLIYTESGAGKVTDLDGNPVDFTTGTKLSRSWGLITADTAIHPHILALVAEMRAADA